MFLPDLVMGGEFNRFQELFLERFPQKRLCKSGEVVFGVHERGRGACFYLLKGCVNGRLVHESGGAAELMLRSEGSIFPLYYAHSTTAMEEVVEFVAMCDCELLVMPKAELRELMLEEPEIGLSMLEAYGALATYLNHALLSTLFDPIKTRLCDFLYMQRNSDNEVVYTQEQIGKAIGAARPNVAGALKELEGRGVISKRRGAVIVVDEQLLLKCCSYPIRQSAV